MWKIITISIAILVVYTNQASTAETCESVLKYAGNKTLKEITTEQSNDLDYYFNCTSEGKQKSGNLGIVYGALEIKLGGSSYKEANSCTEKVRTIDTEQIHLLLQSEPVEAAITAWLSCEKARNYNVQVEMFDDPDAVGTRVENPTTGDLTFWVSAAKLVNGTNTSTGDTCTILPPTAKQTVQAGIVEVKVSAKGATAVSCPRDVVIENRDGIFTRYNPAMNIRMASADADQFSFPFVERIIDGGKVARLDAVEHRLGELGGTVSTLSSRIEFMGGGSEVVRGGVHGAGSGIDHGTAGCPPGEYVAGVHFWGAPGSTKYCIGCFHGAQVVCKPFKTQ